VPKISLKPQRCRQSTGPSMGPSRHRGLIAPLATHPMAAVQFFRRRHPAESHAVALSARRPPRRKASAPGVARLRGRFFSSIGAPTIRSDPTMSAANLQFNVSGHGRRGRPQLSQRRPDAPPTASFYLLAYPAACVPNVRRECSEGMRTELVDMMLHNQPLPSHPPGPSRLSLLPNPRGRRPLLKNKGRSPPNPFLSLPLLEAFFSL